MAAEQGVFLLLVELAIHHQQPLPREITVVLLMVAQYLEIIGVAVAVAHLRLVTMVNQTVTAVLEPHPQSLDRLLPMQVAVEAVLERLAQFQRVLAAQGVAGREVLMQLQPLEQQIQAVEVVVAVMPIHRLLEQIIRAEQAAQVS